MKPECSTIGQRWGHPFQFETSAIINLAVVGRLVGEWLAAWRDAPTSSLMRLVAGMAMLELALFVPVVGWSVLLPLTALAGLGVAVIGLRSRQKVDRPSP